MINHFHLNDLNDSPLTYVGNYPSITVKKVFQILSKHLISKIKGALPIFLCNIILMLTFEKNIDIILKGSVFKMVCKLSLPNFLGVSSMPIIIFMDAFFISKLGNIELASLALVFPFLSVMQMMSAGAIGYVTYFINIETFG